MDGRTEEMKKLQEMSLEELWRLFPVRLREYDPQYPVWYEEERDRVTALVGGADVFRISHIGSTAVPGLLSKPTVDILLELRPGVQLAEAEEKLSAEWLLMSRSDKRFSFNKGYTPQGFADRVFHLHVQPAGDPDELYFRDYLRAFPDTAEEYAALKRTLLRKYEFDRDGYTAAKSEFVRRVTALARGRFAGRYALWRW